MNERSGSLFRYVDLAVRLRPDHPLRTIRALVNETLAALAVDFAALYSGTGRPSIAPGQDVGTLLLGHVRGLFFARDGM